MQDLQYQGQYDEDRILREMFPDRQSGFYVEVGAFDGVTYSNTYIFEQLGWTGVLVEPNPGLIPQCRRARPHSQVVHCAVVGPGAPATACLEICDDVPIIASLTLDQKRVMRETGRLQMRRVEVPARTLDSILGECGAAAIDFITIDVEGHEWNVLSGFTMSRWRPRVVILERNTELPDLRILFRLCREGYAWDRSTGCNDWFVRYHRRHREAARTLARFYLSRFRAAVRVRLRGFLKRVLIRCGLWETVKAVRDRLWGS